MVRADALYTRTGARSPRAIWRACVALARSIASKFSLVTGPVARLLLRSRSGAAFLCFAFFGFLGMRRQSAVRSLDSSMAGFARQGLAFTSQTRIASALQPAALRLSATFLS